MGVWDDGWARRVWGVGWERRVFGVGWEDRMCVVGWGDAPHVYSIYIPYIKNLARQHRASY